MANVPWQAIARWMVKSEVPPAWLHSRQCLPAVPSIAAVPAAAAAAAAPAGGPRTCAALAACQVDEGQLAHLLVGLCCLAQGKDKDGVGTAGWGSTRCCIALHCWVGGCCSAGLVLHLHGAAARR